MNFIKKICLVAFAFSAFTVLTDAEEPAAIVQFARPLAMGGAFTAVADDNNIFAYNPAGLIQRTGMEFTLLELMGGASVDTMEALDFLSDHEDQLTDFENYANDDPVGAANLINEIRTDISKLNPRIFASVNIASYLSGPGVWGLHVGIGALGATDNRFNLNAPFAVPSISYVSNSDVVVPFSLAKSWASLPFVPGRLGLGATAKVLRRFQVSRFNQSVAELDDMDAPPIAEGKAFGGDVGMLYQPTTRINVGAMVQDIGGTKMKFSKVDAEDGFSALPERETVIRARTNLGVSIVPASLLFLLPTGDRWTFSMDIKDVFSPTEHVLFQNGFKKVFGENLYTHTHFGAEFRYWFLRFRGGLNQGYPVGGLGIDIPFLKINYTYFVNEMGLFAGDVKEENHAISVAIKFGSGNVESRERIRRNKEAQKQKKAGGSIEGLNEEKSQPATTPTDSKTSTSDKGKAVPDKNSAETPRPPEAPNNKQTDQEIPN